MTGMFESAQGLERPTSSFCGRYSAALGSSLLPWGRHNCSF